MPPDTCWSLIREKKERKPSGKRDIKDFQGLAVGERLPHTWNTNYVSQRNATLIFVASLTYTSPVLAPFSRSRREEEGGEEEIACTTNTLIHTRARVILCLFASFLLPLFCFFLLLFFSRIKRRGNVSPRIISSIEHEYSRNIRFANKSQQGITWKGTILARVSETRLLVRFVVGQQREKCTLTVG